MNKLRVIQWTTGKVGTLSLRGILDDPRLELVGVYAYSDDKSGSDAGQLCGRPGTGVLATTDIDALIALGADTVFYNPFMADLDHEPRRAFSASTTWAYPAHRREPGWAPGAKVRSRRYRRRKAPEAAR